MGKLGVLSASPAVGLVRYWRDPPPPSARPDSAPQEYPPEGEGGTLSACVPRAPAVAAAARRPLHPGGESPCGRPSFERRAAVSRGTSVCYTCNVRGATLVQRGWRVLREAAGRHPIRQ